MGIKPDRNYVKNAVFSLIDGPRTIEVERCSAGYFSSSSPKYPTVLQQNMMQIFQVTKLRHPVLRYNSLGEPYAIFVPQYPPQPPSGQHSARALFVLMNRLESRLHQGKVDLLTQLAERKKSIQMIQRRIGQAVPLITNYRDESRRLEKKIKKAYHQPRKVRRLIKLLSDLRLEFAFGWRPLASDIYKLGNEIMPPLFYADVRASYVEEQQVLNTATSYVGGYMGFIKLKAFCRVSMSDPLSSSASQLGLTDPAVVLWELVPWSFAVDWILPIGDYLSQLNMFQGLRVEASSLTIRQEGEGDLVNKTVPMASSQLVLKHYRRTQLPSPSLPRFMDSPFGNLSRTFTQLALLGQTVGKTPRQGIMK